MGNMHLATEDSLYPYSIDGPSGEMISSVEQLSTERNVKRSVSTERKLPNMEHGHPDRKLPDLQSWERLRVLKVAYCPLHPD